MANPKKGRRALGDDPLDSLLGGPPAAAPRRQPKQEEPARAAKVRTSPFQLDAELYEEVRDAVVHLSGPPEQLTLNRFAEDALRLHLERMRVEHTKGKRFPKRSFEPRRGRPIGS